MLVLGRFFSLAINLLVSRWCGMLLWCCKKKPPTSRTVWLGRTATSQSFPHNVIRNQKYSVFSFIPLVLFNQFKFFLNLYFLVMACSQFIPALRIGYLYTYWAPLGLVISVTMVSGFCTISNSR